MSSGTTTASGIKTYIYSQNQINTSYGLFYAQNATGLIIDGLAIDGKRYGASTYHLANGYGIMWKNVNGGTINNVQVTNHATAGIWLGTDANLV